MPLPKRVVQPEHVARGTLVESEYGVPNELEEVTNGTLANVIRQLSSLSRLAENIFAELFDEASNVSARAHQLQARADKLLHKTTQFDSSGEEGNGSRMLETSFS
jgi:WAS family protein